jgi:hypothetical protein
MSFDNPHDRREPCLLHLGPAHSPHHHQPVKPALCRGPGHAPLGAAALRVAVLAVARQTPAGCKQVELDLLGWMRSGRLNSITSTEAPDLRPYCPTIHKYRVSSL